ncbi:flavin reductase family protein [Leifsonia shinshuensis]|uniref:flavin reductase family protein n=1 Tax=Leifsonia shinshuensis TaxID=150026 RepID=UPI001F50ECF6|nr:flavin reductase family protein [Leifsonia shinshuensis]MCI0155720.1 flavin reductase family protein [Leifsonia shinshuensis]
MGNTTSPTEERGGVDPATAVTLRRAFSSYPTGVVAVAALNQGQPAGMALNSFTSISLEPALVAVSVARTSSTWPVLADRPRLGLSVLGADHGTLCRQLSARTGDRFAGADWHPTAEGAVLIDGAALWLECGVRETFDGGDHEIVVLEVHGAEAFPEVAPLVFHQSAFHRIAASS